MVLGVKIQDRDTGLFRTKSGSWSKTGKTYSMIGHAKSALSKYYYVPMDVVHADFVIFDSEGGIQKIPCADYIIDSYKKSKDSYYHKNIIPELERFKKLASED